MEAWPLTPLAVDYSPLLLCLLLFNNSAVIFTPYLRQIYLNVTTHAQIEVQAGEDPVDHDLHDLDLDNLDEVDEEDLVLEADMIH